MIKHIAAAVMLAATGVAATGWVGQPSSGAAPGSVAPAESRPLLEVLEGTGHHGTLLRLMKAAGVDDVFRGAGPFTLFAPTDEAFRKLPPGVLEELNKPENKDRLAVLLKQHAVAKALPARDVIAMKESPRTLGGTVFRVAVKPGKVLVGTDPKRMVTVSKMDVAASNGIVHVLDGVMLPKDDAAPPEGARGA